MGRYTHLRSSFVILPWHYSSIWSLPIGGVEGGWTGACGCGMGEEYWNSPPAAPGSMDAPPKFPSCPFPYIACCINKKAGPPLIITPHTCAGESNQFCHHAYSRIKVIGFVYCLLSAKITRSWHVGIWANQQVSNQSKLAKNWLKCALSHSAWSMSITNSIFVGNRSLAHWPCPQQAMRLLLMYIIGLIEIGNITCIAADARHVRCMCCKEFYM